MRDWASDRTGSSSSGGCRNWLRKYPAAKATARLIKVINVETKISLLLMEFVILYTEGREIPMPPAE
jgi:hypothetical protein